MDERMKPVAIGLGAGVLSLVLPGGARAAAFVAGALAAGWVVRRRPVLAAVLFLVPTAVVGTVRLLLDGGSGASAATVGLAIVGAIVFTAFFTHIGAGLALRRERRSA